MKSYIKLVALIAIFLCVSCSHKIGNVLEYNNGNLNVVFKLKSYCFDKLERKYTKTYLSGKVEEKDLGTIPVTLVYADAVVTNTSNQNQKYELSHYRLLSSEKKSNSLHMDDLSYYSTNGELKPKGTITYKVYWRFDYKLTKDDINKLKIMFSESND